MTIVESPFERARIFALMVKSRPACLEVLLTLCESEDFWWDFEFPNEICRNKRDYIDKNRDNLKEGTNWELS